MVVADSAEVSAGDGVTEKVVLIEHKDCVSTPEATGNDFGS